MMIFSFRKQFDECMMRVYNPQIQKSGETKTKGSKSDKNWAESQFQAVIEI